MRGTLEDLRMYLEDLADYEVMRTEPRSAVSAEVRPFAEALYTYPGGVSYAASYLLNLPAEIGDAELLGLIEDALGEPL